MTICLDDLHYHKDGREEVNDKVIYEEWQLQQCMGKILSDTGKRIRFFVRMKGSKFRITKIVKIF